ncbi:MAG: P-II family nitrogen regulator [Gemmatimonadaceae bacterium]|nr:P-II family nitrogen regulator [Gemmatimonadaceae bacterium]
MKMVIAFIQPFMADAVAASLHRIDGLTGATFTDARGFGRGGHHNDRGLEEVVGTVPKVRVEVIVPDALEEEAVRAIGRAARTGKHGDGKVIVVGVMRTLRIATGDEGEASA